MLWEKGYARNDAVLVMRKEGPAHWKKVEGYRRLSLAETAMYRFKPLLAGKISLSNDNGQVGEVMANASAINKLNSPGLPVRKPRSNSYLGQGKSLLACLFWQQRHYEIDFLRGFH